jgi:hypothetical protein
MQVTFYFLDDAESGAVTSGVDSHDAHFIQPW